MFEKLKEKVSNGEYNYRPNIFEVGQIPKSPSTIYIYKTDDKFIVGTTTARSFRAGEREYLIQDEAEQEFLERLQADRRAFHAYQKRGLEYPECPI